MLSLSERTILRLWPAPLSEAQPVSRHRGFSGADIWRVSVGEDHFALRKWPLRAPQPTRLVGLHKLLSELAARGIRQLSVPLPSHSGATLVEFDGGWWQLEPWKPGAADFHAAPSRARLASALTVLARLHRAASNHRPAANCAAWFAPRASAPSPAVRDRLSLIERWQVRVREVGLRDRLRKLPVELREALLELISLAERRLAPLHRQMLPLAEHEFRLQPVLRDVWHDHLLFSGDELTGLIDPSACRVDHPAVDLSRLLTSLLEPTDQPAVDFALGVYQQSQPLTPAELRLFGTLSAGQSLLAGLNWVDRSLAAPIPLPDQPRIAEHLRELLRKAAHPAAEPDPLI